MGWNLNDFTTSLLPNIFIPFLSKIVALHQNVPNCQNILTVLTQRWRIFPQDIWMGQMCMTDAGTTQHNFILPAPPIGGLPISQDWFDRMKLVRDRTISVSLPSGKDILVDTMFKIIIGNTNLGTRQIQCRLGSKICLFIALNASMAGYPTKTNVFLGKRLKDTLSYHHPNQGMFQLHMM